jgi:AcrR family transcriptional regulator
MIAGYSRVDGRSARGERTRAAVATALLSLLQEGNLRPTAAEIAERAGVSLRSVFQHFEDLDTLLAAVADIQFQRLSGLVSDEDGHGPLEARIREFMDRRSTLFERITPVRRAALLQEPFSKELARRLRWAHDLAREEIERTFAPELAQLRPARRADLIFALDAATNWSAWDTLRRMNGLPVDATRRVMTVAVRALLKTATGVKT